MTRNSGDLPPQWNDAARRAARQAAQLDGGECPPNVADRIADAVLAALLAEADVATSSVRCPLPANYVGAKKGQCASRRASSSSRIVIGSIATRNNARRMQ